MCSLEEAEAECSAFFGPTTNAKKSGKDGKREENDWRKKDEPWSNNGALFHLPKRKEGRVEANIFAQKRPRLKWTKWYLFSRDYAFFIFHLYIEHILVFDITGIMREVILLPHKKLKENVKNTLHYRKTE